MFARRLFVMFTSMILIIGDLSYAALPDSTDIVVRPGGIGAPIPPALLNERNDQPSAQDDTIKTNEWYTAGRNTTMQLYQSKKHRNLNTGGLSRLVMVQGTQFQVMKFSKDGQYALIGIDEDGFALDNPGVNANEPTLAWVYVGDLAGTNSQVTDIDALETLAELGIEIETPNMSSTENARRRGGYNRRRGGGGRRSRGGGMTFCLRDVRLWAMSIIGIKAVPQNIEMASQAYPKYKAAGWREIDYSPKVPVGTACFFGGGRKCGRNSRCGHAAIKIAPNKWKGAGVRPTPFLRAKGNRIPYKMHGCLVMPGR